MDEHLKRRIGERVATALGPDGSDVLYDPETFQDPHRTSESIAELIVNTVVEEITRAETEKAQGWSR